MGGHRRRWWFRSRSWFPVRGSTGFPAAPVRAAYGKPSAEPRAVRPWWRSGLAAGRSAVHHLQGFQRLQREGTTVTSPPQPLQGRNHRVRMRLAVPLSQPSWAASRQRFRQTSPDSRFPKGARTSAQPRPRPRIPVTGATRAIPRDHRPQNAAACPPRADSKARRGARLAL